MFEISSKKNYELVCNDAGERAAHTYSDSLWTTFRMSSTTSVCSAFLDHSGDLWFGTANNGVTRHRIKTYPPDTRIISKLDVTTEDNVFFSFQGLDRSTPATSFFRYSFRFDQGEWSPFFASEQVPIVGLAEGRHIFEVRAADRDDNIDTTAASDVFYKIASQHGGWVEFVNQHGRVRLYVPPDEFEMIREATISSVERYAVPDSASLLVAYDIQAQPQLASFKRPATLQIAFLDTVGYDQKKMGIFGSQNSTWEGLRRND
jgi:hypothetical protein